MKLFLLFLTCFSFGVVANSDTLNMWMKQQGKKLDAHDKHFRELYSQITPENWLDDVNSRFTNGYDVLIVDTNNFFVSACKYHSCDEKVVFWYNTNTQKGMLVVIDAASSSTGTPSPIYYLSKKMSKQDIPKIFKTTFNNWLNNENIKIGTEEFYMTDGSKNSDSTKAEVDSLYKKALESFRAGNKDYAITKLENVINIFNLNLNSSSLSLFNDLAYFLEQTKQYTKAESLLIEITLKFPERTVAWLNLGDAQLGLGKSADAKQAYIHYVELMKKAGKEAKVPRRVLEIIK